MKRKRIILGAVAAALEQGTRSAESRVRLKATVAAGTALMGDAEIVSGFGSMGGEEFISYMNVSDALLKTGGKEWVEWNAQIKDRLVKLQNQDGTWAGHHGITGRVACTSAAVLTLLSERTAPRS